jgi:hypothetical protein
MKKARLSASPIVALLTQQEWGPTVAQLAGAPGIGEATF